MQEGILSTIGHTPLIRLTRILPQSRFLTFAKLEGFNPGGSIKDRAAYSILKSALESGDIQPGSVIIESSSGNMGIGIAQACAYLGLQFICVVDSKTTQQNIAILKAYGAQVEVVTEPDPSTGEYLEARIERVKSLQGALQNSWWTNQYSNIFNARAHYQTMHEIVTALNGQVDYLLCPTSTCGTIRGCSDYVQQHRLATKIIAVDARGSVIFGDKLARRLIPGHGASIQPGLYHPDMVYSCVHVSDLECVVGCRRLLRQEAILAGGSSGGAIMAATKIQHAIPAGARCVAILCDRGERYLSTIYSDDWVVQHFGDVLHLWDEEHCKGIEQWQTATY
jgi:N-(2-amino-2-carboxyethyl)-L-glutamate synthase